MQPHDFGQAVMPALVSANGITRLALGRTVAPTGVEVWQWPNGLVEAAVQVRAWYGSYRGDPALSPDGRLIAFFDGGDIGQVYEIDTGLRVFTTPSKVRGTHPVLLRNTSIVYQEWDYSGIYEQRFDGSPRVWLHEYSATGLSHLTAAGVVTVDENRTRTPPFYGPMDAGDCTVGLHPDSGILLQIGSGGPIGWWRKGEQWNDPAVCQDGSDSYTVAVWQPSVALRVLAGITAADIGSDAFPLFIPSLPPPRPTGTVHVRALPRKLWIAPFFSHSEQYGWTPLEAHVGNAILTGGADVDKAGPLHLPMILDAAHPVDPRWLNQTIAWWTSGASAAELGAVVSRALALEERPVIAYLDQTEPEDWPLARPAWVTDRVWPSVQAYRRAGEPLDWFASRVGGMLARVAAYEQPIVLVPRFDDADLEGPGWSVQQTLECMPLYDHWIREYFIVGLLPFSDRRGHGMAHYPELRAWAAGFLEATVARPNRYDYWIPSDGNLATVLENKLGQSVEMVVLSRREKVYLLAALDGQPDPDPDDPPPPDDEPPDPEAVKAALEEEREKFPHFDKEQPITETNRPLTPLELGTLLNDAARRFGGVGLHRVADKAIQPHTKIGVSWDVLRAGNGKYWSDVIEDADGFARPYAPTWKLDDTGLGTFVPAV